MFQIATMDATTSRSLMNTGDESDGSTANGGYYSDSDDDESTSSETKTPNNGENVVVICVRNSGSIDTTFSAQELQGHRDTK